MKQEDTDWRVYHAMPECGQVPDTTVAEKSGLPLADVQASLDRLERYGLIERSGINVRILSFGEALIKNQIKYEKDLPFVIENGVIREKKR